MRNKIKQIMKKEEGFTLVELLAVIVILGIIVAIAIPAVGSVINRSQEQATAAEVSLVEDAARLYFTSYEDDEGERPAGKTVTVEVLKSTGYLDTRESTISDSRIVTNNDDGTFTLDPVPN